MEIHEFVILYKLNVVPIHKLLFKIKQIQFVILFKVGTPAK